MTMTISDFYLHPAIIEGFGRGRTYKVINQLREVWPGILGKESSKIGNFPYYRQHVNQYYAAWLLFILSNCKSHNREDVIRAIHRGQALKDKEGNLFVLWLADTLADPNYIRANIRSIYIFYDEDNMASVFTEVQSRHKGANLLFHGDSPAFKIRRSAVLEKEFLVEVAELIHDTVRQQEKENLAEPGITDSDGEYHDKTMSSYIEDYETMDFETKLKVWEQELRAKGHSEEFIRQELDKARVPRKE